MKQKMLKSVYGSLHKLFTSCYFLFFHCSLSPHLLTLTDTSASHSPQLLAPPPTALLKSPENVLHLSRIFPLDLY